MAMDHSHQDKSLHAALWDYKQAAENQMLNLNKALHGTHPPPPAYHIVQVAVREYVQALRCLVQQFYQPT
eukprot:873636-Prorocentrum_minimum.AAC.2